MQATKRNKRLTYALLIVAMIAVMGLVGISEAGAKSGRGRSCHGTYYVNINEGGNYALWTFNQDGTFQGTDSAEKDFDFSHQQGAWQHTTAREVKATWLDFGVNIPGVTRVNSELEFSDRCQTFGGGFEGASYNLSQDPFDPNAIPGFTFSGSFTGQRINP